MDGIHRHRPAFQELETLPAIASRPTRTCWVVGNFISTMDGNTALTYDPDKGHMHNISHEIGHILIGPGHPDSILYPGPAPLRGTNLKERLMASGGMSGNATALTQGKLLVKGEWDEAEIWLTTEENNGRL